jgi:predicted esterase
MRTPPDAPSTQAAEPQPPASGPESANAEASSPEAPETKFFSLKVDGFEPAVVAVPGGPPRTRPMLIAAHGAGCMPEHHCLFWAEIVRDRAVVVCPRGVALRADSDHGFYFPHHHHLDREVLAVISAARAALGNLVDEGPIVYVGYSQGASMGALVAHRHPKVLSKLVLIEGGQHQWDVPTARAFQRGGGERVLLVCGQGGCARVARRAATWLTRAGVEARAEYATGAGHTFLGAVAERLRDSFDWLVAGDPRWTVPVR